MALIRFTTNNFDPLERLLDLQRELERFLHNPTGFDLGPSGGGVYPPINVFGDRDGIVVRAEVPGVAPEGLAVEIERRRLTISGERAHDPQTSGSYHRHERQFGKFSRTIQLPPDLDASKAVADCRNGVVTIRIPKAEAAKPRQIKVAVA